MTRYTVLGASGFIGSALVRRLREEGNEVFAPERGALLTGRQLGHVFYCIGLTADFRQRPFDTAEAHVGVLSKVLEHAQFDSLLYLSSTRVYAGAGATHEETPLSVRPGDASDLYNLSKLLGESLCLNCERSNVRVARLANVVGYDPGSENFLMSLVREAVRGTVRLGSTLSSSKDYIALDDVLALLPLIARSGRQTLYNVASGRNITHQDICAVLQAVTGCTVTVMEGVARQQFPVIDIHRIREELAFQPSDPLLQLPRIVEQCKSSSQVQ